MKPGNRLYCRKVLIPAEDVSQLLENKRPGNEHLAGLFVMKRSSL